MATPASEAVTMAVASPPPVAWRMVSLNSWRTVRRHEAGRTASRSTPHEAAASISGKPVRARVNCPTAASAGRTGPNRLNGGPARMKVRAVPTRGR